MARQAKRPLTILQNLTDRVELKPLASCHHARTLPPVGFVAPMLPTFVDEAPEGAEWIHESKFDGYLTSLTIRGKDVPAYPPTRHGFCWSERDHERRKGE